MEAFQTKAEIKAQDRHELVQVALVLLALGSVSLGLELPVGQGETNYYATQSSCEPH